MQGAVRSARRAVRGRERGVRDCEWPATGAWVFTVPAADWPLLPTALWRLESACGLRSSAVRRERQRLPGKRRGRLGCFGASMWCCGAVLLVRRAFEFARERLVHGLGAERRTAGARRLRLNGSPWAGRGEPVSGVSGEAVCEHAAAACCALRAAAAADWCSPCAAGNWLAHGRTAACAGVEAGVGGASPRTPPAHDITLVRARWRCRVRNCLRIAPPRRQNCMHRRRRQRQATNAAAGWLQPTLCLRCPPPALARNCPRAAAGAVCPCPSGFMM